MKKYNLTITTFIKGDFIGYEGTDGVEVTVTKLVPGANYLTFEPYLIDNCFANTSLIASGMPPINRTHLLQFCDVEWIKINGHKIDITPETLN